MSEVQVQGEIGDVERREPANELALGQWYWVLPSAGEQEAGEPDLDEEPIEDGDDVDGRQSEFVEDEPLGVEHEDIRREHDDDCTGPSPDANAPIEGAWLGCVMKIGSNFVELVQPTIYGSSGIRVHVVHFWRDLVHEPDPEKYLRGKAMYWRSELERLIGEMNQLCGRLGLRRTVALPGAASLSSAAGSTDLVVLSGQIDPHQYKRALVLAKEQQLPQLDKDIRHATEQLGRWMKAMTLSAKAAIVPLHETIETVDDRLFTVGLYAGLSEDAVRCCDGAAAAEDEKLHVMQRMLFMDEECLLDWKHGGMEFKTLKAYERWLCRPNNRDRILPFPRSLVAMRVRRNTKERDFDGSIMDALAKLGMEIQDKFTYLYVRNGEQVWRISCEFDFPEMIFPDYAFYATGEPLMAQASPSEVSDFMTLSEYEQRVAECVQAEKELKDWKKAHPDEDEWFSPPGRTLREDPRNRSWHLVSPDWVYYDEAMAVVEAKVKEFNRIAVIIQGLFDRSMVLNPHRPVRAWTAAGFNEAIRLVYDASNVLNYGEPPDIGAYIAKCNESLGIGSIVVGQELAWEKREAVNANERERRQARGGAVRGRRTKYRPYGDPGPGLVARIEDWRPRTRKAKFTWFRKSAQWNRHDEVQCSITVSANDLFNVSAYRMGDYLQFFKDPRTRAKYLEWAPLLMAAEDYHAGKIALGPQDGNHG